jgi:hypothetical protein
MIDSHELDFARTVGKRLDEHRELIEDIERATGYFSSEAGQWSRGHALTQDDYLIKLYTLRHGHTPESDECVRALPSFLLQSDLLATVDPLGEDWEKTKDE